MQIVFLTGRVGGDAETRSAGNGEVTSFNLAVDQGWGERKTTNWFRVSIWGDRGRKLAGHILKGNKLAVTGELSIGEYNGKPQYEVRASECDPFMGGPSPRQTDGQQGAPSHSGNAQAHEPDLADDVPFASCDPTLERRVS
jgi:single-strand DNA-binding protein